MFTTVIHCSFNLNRVSVLLCPHWQVGKVTQYLQCVSGISFIRSSHLEHVLNCCMSMCADDY